MAITVTRRLRTARTRVCNLASDQRERRFVNRAVARTGIQRPNVGARWAMGAPAARLGWLRVILAITGTRCELVVLAVRCRVNNPFSRISGGGTSNKRREHYADLDMFGRLLLNACQSPMDRVLLTLYRIAGLRSAEALLLTW